MKSDKNIKKTFWFWYTNFIYFCFVSTSCCNKNKLPLFLSQISSFLAWTFHYFSFFSIFLSHAVQQKYCRQMKPTDRTKIPEKNQQKKMFYLFFHIFFTFNLCLRAFSGCLSVFPCTWEHINFVFSFNPRKFFKVLAHRFSLVLI